jgi:hypothetical protein
VGHNILSAKAKIILRPQAKYLTLKSLLFNDTLLLSLPTSQMRKYSPDVAIKSLCVPAYYTKNMALKNSRAKQFDLLGQEST